VDVGTQVFCSRLSSLPPSQSFHLGRRGLGILKRGGSAGEYMAVSCLERLAWLPVPIALCFPFALADWEGCCRRIFLSLRSQGIYWDTPCPSWSLDPTLRFWKYHILHWYLRWAWHRTVSPGSLLTEFRIQKILTQNTSMKNIFFNESKNLPFFRELKSIIRASVLKLSLGILLAVLPTTIPKIHSLPVVKHHSPSCFLNEQSVPAYHQRI